ncbi:MAG: helix-turn-helix transcriptional regulator [Lachnospiraceae bacterium]|nr:helix-turn-helix transcriptional regulator [Lachnospiraceae bacterium]
MPSDFKLFYLNNPKEKPVLHSKQDYHRFYFLSEGHDELSFHDHKIPLSFGQVVLIPPEAELSLTTESQSGHTGFLLCIRSEYLYGLENKRQVFRCLRTNLLLTEPYVLTPRFSDFRTMENRLLSIFSEQQEERYGWLERVELFVREIYLLINRIFMENVAPYEPKKEAGTIRDICAYVDEHLAEDLTLSSLAERFFVSESYIAHSFQKSTGLPFHRYLLRQRVELVKEALLRGEDISNKHAAYGFRYYSGLYRAFKNEVGMSPAEFRKTHAIGWSV